MDTRSFNRILVGWDGSQGAADSLYAACRMAGNNGEVLALAIIPTYSHVEADEERERAVTQLQEPLTRRYEQVLAKLASTEDIRVALKLLEGDSVAETLLSYSIAHSYDLVVLGLHGNEGEIHHKLGHVANHVVKSGCCPVLLMPSESATSASGEFPSTGVRRSLLHPFGRRATTDAP